jgi:hypothetical protein
MLSEEILERAVTDICNDAGLSAKGQHGDYYRCIIAQASADATEELGNQLEAVAGALADAGIDFKTTDRAEAVRELTRERDWFALLASAALAGIANWWSDTSNDFMVATTPGQVFTIERDANGLPVETDELRQAIEAAMKE